MSGTFSIAYTQQFDAETGRFLSGGLLYVYDADTTNLVSVYEDSGLTLSQANPLELDSAGRIGAIWVDDGSYRLVLRNADGITQFDITSTPAIGASTSSGSSSSSGTSVDAESLIKTGYTLWLPVSGSLDGFVRMNGRTISSASGAGAERANADVQDLFLYAWNNFSDVKCPVSGGRGISAAADWAANKAIATLDMREALAFGLPDMGNTDLGDFGPVSASDHIGDTSQALQQTNVPDYNLSLASLTGSVGTTISNGTTVIRGGSSNTQIATGGTHTVFENTSQATLSLASGTVTFGGSIPSGGSGTGFSIVNYGLVGTWYWKL